MIYKPYGPTNAPVLAKILHEAVDLAGVSDVTDVQTGACSQPPMP